MRCPLFILALFIALTPSVGSATTWTVLPDSTGDAPTIQAGTDSAAAGDTVMVMCGTYYEYDINMKGGVLLTSETGMADCAVIDAGGLGRGIICDGIAENAVIAGLTVTGGAVIGLNGRGLYCRLSKVAVANCRFHDNSTDSRGGGAFVKSCSPDFMNCELISNVAETGEECEGAGVYVHSGEPVLDGCQFKYNTATYGDGGGLYCRYGGGSPLVIGCTFEHNGSNFGGGLALATDGGSPEVQDCIFRYNIAGSGGALAGGGCDVTVTGCTFHGNEASCGGGLFYWFGDALTVTGCSFTSNHAGSHGGAFALHEDSPGILAGCDFINNSANVEGGAGAVLFGSSVTVDSCVFAKNQAMGSGARHGGVVSIRDRSSLEMSRCTLHGNQAVSGAGVSFRQSSTGTLGRSIIASGVPGEGLHWDGSGGEPPLSCCDIYGNTGGDWIGLIADQYGINGNISEVPLFCDPGSDDFTLDTVSPCNPDYSPEGCGLIGARSVGCGEAGVPDPFRNRTEVIYAIAPGRDISKVVVGIYDIAGRRVKTLVSEKRGAGIHRVAWDATDHTGAPVASGVYSCSVSWNGRNRTRPIVLLR